ncbi:39S ribosomal protein L40, mitochondrial isoform X1 [Colletes gigas]|uniref:39S ribosomal protein L40, mitochondrial isoform X1 n=1 Tax=Colletes gigas TaxID=935657 RepID=UPI001C9A794F|nr:39S ribosomal protein L40, mitochondrial isoform X1 [Colletes gigas]
MIGVLNVVNTFSRLSMSSIVSPCNVSTCAYPLYFRVTDMLLGEPLKKKRRLDPSIIRAREERKKKKLEKQIRRLQRHVKQLKPLNEINVPTELIEQKEYVIYSFLPFYFQYTYNSIFCRERSRPLTPLSIQEIERRSLLIKEWSKYKHREWKKDVHVMESIMLSQEKALNELKAASEELYKKAIETDDSFLPYSAVGPVHNPPINDYDSPDGVYINITTKYVGET